MRVFIGEPQMPYAFSKPESVNDSLWPWDASGMRPNFRQICNNAAKAQYPIYEMKEVVYQGKNSYTLGMRPYGTPSYAKSGYILQFRHKGHHINMSLNMSHVAWRARLEPRKIPRYDPVTWGPVTRVSEYIIVYMAVAFDETIPYENWQLSTPKLGHNFQHQVYLIRSFAQAMAHSCPTTQVDLIIGTLDRSSWKEMLSELHKGIGYDHLRERIDSVVAALSLVRPDYPKVCVHGALPFNNLLVTERVSWIPHPHI